MATKKKGRDQRDFRGLEKQTIEFFLISLVRKN